MDGVVAGFVLLFSHVVDELAVEVLQFLQLVKHTFTVGLRRLRGQHCADRVLSVTNEQAPLGIHEIRVPVLLGEVDVSEEWELAFLEVVFEHEVGPLVIQVLLVHYARGHMCRRPLNHCQSQEARQDLFHLCHIDHPSQSHPDSCAEQSRRCVLGN